MNQDAHRLLTMALAIGPTDAIEMEERRGAAQLRTSSQIPTKEVADRVLIAFGFELGAVIPDRDGNILRHAKLPPGWTKEGEGSYWTYLISPQGYKIFSIFYKAVFYDRRADMHLNPRFSISQPHTESGFQPVYELRDLSLPKESQVLYSVPFTGNPYSYEAEVAVQQVKDYADANLFIGWDNAATAWLKALNHE